MRKLAEAHLQKDPVMADLIDRHPSFEYERPKDVSPYGAIMRAIIYQQISGKAAASIHGRFLDLFPGEMPSPNELANSEIETLRGAGLSNAKAKAVIDLARKTLDGSIPPTNELLELPDDQIIERLTAVWGVGQWTAEMYLIFTLGRPDILPLNDIGIQNGAKSAYRMRKRPDAKRLTKIGKKWGPYRSWASWYLWREADLQVLPGG